MPHIDRQQGLYRKRRALVAPYGCEGALFAAVSTTRTMFPLTRLAIARGLQANKPGWSSQNGANVAAAKSEEVEAFPKKIENAPASYENTSNL